MKILLIGEGKHELGSSGVMNRPRPAAGFLFILVQKICPNIGSDSVELSWTNLNLIMKKEPRKKFASRQGLAKKVQYAIVQARRQDCQGTVCVHDRDCDADRLTEMENGREAEITKQNDGHEAICAVAIESIEAWLLGAPSALASVLQSDLDTIQKHVKEYSPSRVEELKETSEDEKKQPKKLLAQIINVRPRTLAKSNTEFREDVASQLDHASLTELEKNCPEGFRPFANKLRAAFGPRPT